MQTATQQAATTFPYWDKLKDLSNKDKLILISMLSESMIEPKKETFEEQWAKSLTIEEFSKLCDEKIDMIYGKE